MTPAAYSLSREGQSTGGSLVLEGTTMHNGGEGLPAAASVEQAIILAQLQILRQLERQRHAR